MQYYPCRPGSTMGFPTIENQPSLRLLVSLRLLFVQVSLNTHNPPTDRGYRLVPFVVPQYMVQFVKLQKKKKEKLFLFLFSLLNVKRPRLFCHFAVLIISYITFQLISCMKTQYLIFIYNISNSFTGWNNNQIQEVYVSEDLVYQSESYQFLGYNCFEDCGCYVCKLLIDFQYNIKQ